MASSTFGPSVGTRWAARRMKLRIRTRVLIRAYVRNSHLGLLAVAAVIGVVVGLGVVLVEESVRHEHLFAFGVPVGEHLSGTVSIEAWRILVIPCLGGLLYGVLSQVVRRKRPREIVDAIEANALYGGQMSLTDSLRLTIQTVVSSGVGASVGLEAAYTQLGAGLASRLGRLLKLRRADLRTMVGCGAAAAIAAAFNAPLAGAFYAFELIIGSYTLATLGPVAIAALAATMISREVFGAEPIFIVFHHAPVIGIDYLLFIVVGIAAAGLGIAAMHGVTMIEAGFRRRALPQWFRPCLGGLVLGGIALIYPQVLGAGHGGILATMNGDLEWPIMAGLLVAKLVASAISIGSGFRGGMFSSSLFLGSLFGSLVGVLAVHVVPGLPSDYTAFTVVGMGAVAAAVVGAPITMILLVLEATADFPVTVGVMVAVLVASIIVREWFGYSFATWRFHLRGVPIRGAHDIGWVHDLTVGRLMRRDIHVAPATMPLDKLRALYPVGGAKWIFVVDAAERYVGLLDNTEAHNPDLDAQLGEKTAGDLAHGGAHFLLPDYPVRTALDLFMAAELETLAVVTNSANRRVVGYLTEAYALRRYNRELERLRSEELGDDNLYGPVTPA